MLARCDARPNISFLEDHMVVDLIKQVDEVKPALPKLEQMVFPVVNRKASDVAEQLKEIIDKMRQKQGAAGADTEMQIIANNANNSIMVLAEETEREKIQRLLNELDVEPAKGWGEVKLTLFPLLHSKADELAKVITDLIVSKETADKTEEVIYRLAISKASPTGEIVELPPIDLQKPMRILADGGTNSLIVATVEENVGPIGELIRLMDGLALAEDVNVRLFPLRFADADSVAEVLQKMFDQGGELTEDPDGSGQAAVPEGAFGKALVYNVNITTDTRTNTLIVVGRAEQLDLSEMIVSELVTPETRVLRLRSDKAGSALADAMREQGAAVEDVILYNNEPVAYDSAPAFDSVFFASASAVEVFVDLWGTQLLESTTVVAIGIPTVAALEERGVTVDVVGREATVPGAMEELARKMVRNELERQRGV